MGTKHFEGRHRVPAAVVCVPERFVPLATGSDGVTDRPSKASGYTRRRRPREDVISHASDPICHRHPPLRTPWLVDAAEFPSL